MNGRLELDRIRERRAARADATRLDPDPGTPAMVGRVVSPASAIGPKKFLLVKPVTVLGTECEGCAPSLTVGSATVPVLLLGPRLPAPGDDLICRFVGHRWVAEKTGGPGNPGGGVVLPSCNCRVPFTLQMTSRDPSCNYGMFQSATLQYGPAPPEMASFALDGPMFTSVERFTDQVTGLTFYYYFWCRFNQFFLEQIFTSGPSGPFRTGIEYAWVAGGYLSTCNPFYLFEGSAFPGSDRSCSIEVKPAGTQVPYPPPNELPPAGQSGGEEAGDDAAGGGA